jgi:hypothetical protein
MPGTPGPLQQSGNALGRPDLQDPFDRQEVDAEVQARRAHHGLQAALLHAEFDPVAGRAIERAVMQGDQARPVGPSGQDRLVPEFGLRAGVGEDQRRRASVEFGDHRRQHLHA